MKVDERKLNEFVEKAVTDLAAGYGGVMTVLGHKLGLYKAMAHAGPLDSSEIAKRSGCAERYVREWLNSQAAAGYVLYHATSATYELTPEQSLVLAKTTARYLFCRHGKCRLPCSWTKRKPSTPFAPAKASPGTSTMSGFFAASRPFTETATGTVWFASGCRRSAAWRKNYAPAPKLRM